MAISDKKTVEVGGEPTEFGRGEVLMSRGEKFGEWLKNSPVGKAIVGENYEKLKYWAALGGALQGESIAQNLEFDTPGIVLTGAAGAVISGGITEFLRKRDQIGHRLVPNTITT